MASQRSSFRRSTVIVATALAGASALGGCGTPGPSQTPETTAPSVDVASQQAWSTATADNLPMERYTAGQVRSAVASVDSVDSPLELSTEQVRNTGFWDATVEPARCEEPLKDGIEFQRRHIGIPKVTAVGDEGRLRVEATVYPEAKLADAAGAAEETKTGGACSKREVTSLESGVSRRTTNTSFAVEMPEEASRVTAATSDVTVFDPGFSNDSRHSLVSAVVDNVSVTVTYGPPVSNDGSADLDSVPVQAERAAAERAARQVISELTGSS